MIKGIADFILRNAYEDPDSDPLIIGVNWITNFLNRYPELHVRLSRPIAFDRQWAQNLNKLKKWYITYERILKEFGIRWQDVWNFDETGFSIECGGAQKIVIRITNKKTRIFHPNSECRTHLLSAEIIRITGEVGPLIVILKGKQYLEKWFSLEVGLHSDIIVGLNDSGYMNDKLSMTYIRHFD
jgi:hypothetical protein